MAQAPLAKLQTADIAVVRGRAELPEACDALIANCATAAEAIQVLTANDYPIEASRLIAHAMPRREAVWWACMCARHTRQDDILAGDIAALEAAELWVRKPTDENRRAAFAVAQESGFRTAEAWACVAAFWSGDSMAPLGQPIVPPAPNLTGMAVAGSVALASVRGRPALQITRMKAFLDSARDIANGGTGRLEPETQQGR